MDAKRWVLAKRPEGLPDPSDFRLEAVSLSEPGDGEVLIQCKLISVDPGMRSRLSRDSYGQALKEGDVIDGFNLGEVVRSQNPAFAEGDLVTGGFGWQSAFLSNGRGWLKLDRALLASPVGEEAAIGILGVPGLTAYFGLLEVGSAKEGETVLISSCAGPVGATAGQIAKINGNRVVGIAGTPEKCAFAKEIGFDGIINYKTCGDLEAAIREACPDGVDVFFDNVGAETLDAAIANMNVRGRIVLSGQLAEYNRTTPYGTRRTADFIGKRLRMEGLVVFDFRKRYGEAMAAMAGWIREGRLKHRTEVFDGFERLPEAFIGVLKGENEGRRLVKV